MSPADLSDLLSVVQRFGVRRFRLDDLEVEFAPEPQKFYDIASAVSAATESETCACGHHLVTEHSEHGCLRGCDLAVCAPSEAAQ
jgi:hypothetical protein